MKKFQLVAAVLALGVASATAFAVQPDQKNLPIGLAPHEIGLPLPDAHPSRDIPAGHVRSLGEWELSDSAITLWTNPSYVKALAQHGPVKILADSASDVSWWKNFFKQNSIPSQQISFWQVSTDSMWVRDYGPWYILDGQGKIGIVDTTYNRPRPKDDLVPQFIGKQLGIPVYTPGLVHTGGNYYSDGQGNAFSSTLVYSENSRLSSSEVNKRMADYLGIDSYHTSPLAPGITIEHMDTFGKLVAPDTWVFSEFPEGSRFRADSEKYLAMLKTLKSPYGTPYKIFRLKMVERPGSGDEDYRAYINSFISNRALYFPTYGDATDDEVKKIYQAALPGYDIVGVDNGDTEWGDSVHCRSNNLYSKDTVFVFPTVTPEGEVHADVVPAAGSRVAETPVVHYSVNGSAFATLPMAKAAGDTFDAHLPAQARGAHVSLYIEAKDSLGHEKRAPIVAPMTIDYMAN